MKAARRIVGNCARMQTFIVQKYKEERQTTSGRRNYAEKRTFAPAAQEIEYEEFNAKRAEIEENGDASA